MRPRVNKLQTLEAKMASIEVSLGWKRRREALLETLPRAARDLVRELDTLHQALRDKDTVIQSLKTQITNLGGTVGGSGEGGGALTEAERRSVQERLVKVQAEEDSKRVTIKNLKLTLEKIDITDNIDVRIRAAELEYELEREELNILNLREEANVLNTRLQDNTPSPASSGVKGSNSSLHTLLTSAGGSAALGGASLLSLTVPHTPGNPPFHVTPRPPLGCVIDWATDDTRLKKGDRLVEVNGEGVVSCGLEQVTRVMAKATHLNLVVARPIIGTGSRKVEDRGKEVKDLSVKLDKTLKEKDTYKSDNTRLSHRISYLEEQVLELQNTLGRTRETGRAPAEGEAIVTTSHQPGATVIQVFQKGEQRLAVASPELGNGEVEHAQQYPTLPRIRSPDSALSSPTSCSSSTSSSAFSDPNHSQHHSTKGQGGMAKQPNTDHHRRVLSPRPESKNEDSRPTSRTKPIPPKKPERLSLQRTTSLQNVEEGPGNISAPSHSTFTSSSRHQPLHTWPSIDKDIHCQEQEIYSQAICERGCKRPDYHSHENIYEKQQERLPPHHSWDHDHHHLPNGGGDGSVMMVVSASPVVTAESLGRRPAPQGASATTVTTTTTTLGERPRFHYHYNHQQPVQGTRRYLGDVGTDVGNQGTRRPLSPDASYHLDTHIPRTHDDARDMYSHTTTTTHYNAATTPSHNHRTSHPHDHAHQRISALSHHSHFTLHSPPTPVASRNSATLTMASSPRPHEQWC
ncbi:hypothetical protein GWK47_047298 [Chionoecetes opilio]|uniref:PDZ domain-containing protein n=1 Tax=Chionoecetes opilio TaxID=41210 RepID=A0A8J5CUG9_CHIOP|nr:hypothetical protein GWK47_047298 [Chionoecetes opilio]